MFWPVGFKRDGPEQHGGWVFEGALFRVLCSLDLKGTQKERNGFCLGGVPQNLTLTIRTPISLGDMEVCCLEMVLGSGLARCVVWP